MLASLESICSVFKQVKQFVIAEAKLNVGNRCAQLLIDQILGHLLESQKMALVQLIVPLLEVLE